MKHLTGKHNVHFSVSVALGFALLMTAHAAPTAALERTKPALAPAHIAAAAPNAQAICTAGTTTALPNLAIPDRNFTYSCVDLVATDIGTVHDISVSTAVTHTAVTDLDMQLRSPDGKSLTLLTRAGRPTTAAGYNADLYSTSPIVFASFGVDAELMGAGLSTTGVICRDDAKCSYRPNPDGDTGSTLSNTLGFFGVPSVGTWRFCIRDTTTSDVGSLASVSLTLTCYASRTFLPIAYR